MAMKAEEALAIAKSYTKKSLEGQGALKGQDGKDGVSPVISVNTSTADTYKLDITDKNGTITTPNLVGKQGLQGIQGEQGKPADNPIITENADNTEDVYKLDLTVGETVFTTKNIKGKQGLEGVSPTVTTNPDNTTEDYRLNITTKGGSFTTPNLRGPQGERGPIGESAVSAINPRGDYDVNAEPSYTKSDYITYTDGNTYVCKLDNPTNEPPIDGTVTDTYWQVIAFRGAQGIAGKDGEKGADGVTFTPSIDENGVLSFTNNGGLENPEPIDIKGKNGVTFTPSIDADGNLSFTNNGNLENPEPIKVLGKDGVDGKDGIDGTTYIPSIGTVTTVESNADASAGVTVDEETKEAVFHFEIPKGADGEKAVQFTPSITENGELAWENDGDLENPPTTPIQTMISTAPLGTVLSFAGSKAPNGYLLCDGKSYAVADYEDLYAVIGNTYGGDSTNFNVPDYRETVLVGVGENTTDTIASHDVYELGEFKDDQLQGHEHSTYKNYESGATGGAGSATNYGGVISTLDIVSDATNGEPRKGTTTHGKQKGVTYIIKAFHTNEGVDSGVSDDVVDYVDNKVDELISDTSSSTTSTYSSDKIDEKIDGTAIQTTTTTDYEYYAITYGDSISAAYNQGILIQYNRLNFPPSTYIFSTTSYVTDARETVSVAKISNNFAGKSYDLRFYIDKDNKTMYLKMPSYSRVSLQDLAFKSKAVAYTKVDAIPSTATVLAVAEYTSINDSSTGDTVSTWSSSKIASSIIGTKTQYRGSRSIDINTGGKLTLIYSSEYASQAGCYMLLSNFNTEPLLIELGRSNIGQFSVTATHKSQNVDTITVTTAGDEYSWCVLQF